MANMIVGLGRVRATDEATKAALRIVFPSWWLHGDDTWHVPYVEEANIRSVRNDETHPHAALAGEVLEALEAAALREQIAWTFGLTGGELDDKPWLYVEHGDTWTEKGERVDERDLRLGQRTYWYDGPPEWSEFIRDHRNGPGIYRTEVDTDLAHGAPEIGERRWDREDGTEWECVAVFTSEGEPECPCKSEETQVGLGGCWLCEEKPGEEHGVLGFGGYGGEVVWRLVRDRSATDHPSIERALMAAFRVLMVGEHAEAEAFYEEERWHVGCECGATWMVSDAGTSGYSFERMSEGSGHAAAAAEG